MSDKLPHKFQPTSDDRIHRKGLDFRSAIHAYLLGDTIQKDAETVGITQIKGLIHTEPQAAVVERELAFKMANIQKSPILPTKIGIIGAGAAGLYTAILLDLLDIDYEIFEVNDRVGGRMFTHTFPDLTKDPKEREGTVADEHAYVEMGPMRFPEISGMERLYHLFKHLNLDTHSYRQYNEVNRRDYVNGNLVFPSSQGTANDPYRLFTNDKLNAYPPGHTGVKLEDNKKIYDDKHEKVIYSVDQTYSHHIESLLVDNVKLLEQALNTCKHNGECHQDETVLELDRVSFRQFLVHEHNYPAAFVCY